MDHVRIVKKQVLNKLMKSNNTVGVGVGYKHVNGESTDKPAIIVFVKKKFTTGGVQKLAADELVPQKIDTTLTDVIEVGDIIKQAGFRSRIRPIRPGYSCGHPDITAGTIGGIFLDKDGETVILSNNHVLANENKAKIGDPIYQPGPMDSNSREIIGYLKSTMILRENGNRHDSAIARIDANTVFDTNYPINGGLRGFATAQPGMRLQKCGRTTGHTTGKIIAIDASFTIGYDFGPATFDDCIVTTCMSDGGDSGSILTDMQMNAVGLLFAGSPKVTIANEIKTVVDHYGLRLLNAGQTPPTTPQDKLLAFDGSWKIVNSCNGVISGDKETAIINAKGNGACYLERSLGGFKSITCQVNTGTDFGATWGPGITVIWPNGSLKLNLRHGGSFGGYINTNERLGIGSTKPNTTYDLRIRSTISGFVGEVYDNGSWYVVAEAPRSMFKKPPVCVRFGKTDSAGGPNNHTDLGQDGQCSISKVVIT